MRVLQKQDGWGRRAFRGGGRFVEVEEQEFIEEVVGRCNHKERRDETERIQMVSRAVD